MRPVSKRHEEKSRTDTERMWNASRPKHNTTLRRRAPQRSQNDLALLDADPPVLPRIINTNRHVLCARSQKKVRVEFAHALHLVVRHRQRRIDGPGRAQQVMQDLELAFGPGGLHEAEEHVAQGVGDEVPEELGEEG